MDCALLTALLLASLAEAAKPQIEVARVEKRLYLYQCLCVIGLGGIRILFTHPIRVLLRFGQVTCVWSEKAAGVDVLAQLAEALGVSSGELLDT